MTRRLHELDALRGFAICGIMVVNTWQHTRGHLEDPGRPPVDWAVENLLQGRFYPVFSFLFGLSFVLFLRSAAGRTPRPRLALLRRLAVLACFGAVHWAVNPGEVLLPYALFGMLVLLPASFLPRSAVLLLGAAVTAWAASLGGGFVAGGVFVVVLVPGLFLIGAALMEYRPPERLLLPAFLASAAAGGWLVWLWNGTYATGLYTAAGLACAAAYCTGLLLLLRTRLRGPLTAVLNPLGRMALTNYLMSTPVILLALPLLTADPTRWAGVALAAAVLAVQTAFSRWWLARFRYGPLEWVWRCLTWMERVPNRRIGSEP
ncbi:DUF418 domain-containing protein [Planomonospora parontospora]|uniref:DUF418 domain-containing protein n=1 Tax=Planomonospora parontospora TaxID=58119 RepID=UPI00199E5F2B|nr:DUF418 domain-containing protein [Planomonospora parontospora]GGL51764.1 hypothetical protein GCM10014719_61410 [Planomonospora parontospora subsp. antibiotica]GII19362.1 hypothetical protein Ppa05_60880 [Planomonospora parontospora subsp. antibiotica]